MQNCNVLHTERTERLNELHEKGRNTKWNHVKDASLVQCTITDLKTEKLCSHIFANGAANT